MVRWLVRRSYVMGWVASALLPRPLIHLVEVAISGLFVSSFVLFIRSCDG